MILRLVKTLGCENLCFCILCLASPAVVGVFPWEDLLVSLKRLVCVKERALTRESVQVHHGHTGHRGFTVYCFALGPGFVSFFLYSNV